MKVSPIILAFFSDRLRLRAFLGKFYSGSILTFSSTPSLVLKVVWPARARQFWSSPLSTKTKIKSCGIAAVKSAAVTELSTPPLTAQRTFVAYGFDFSDLVLAKLPIFHVLSQPQIYLAKFFKIWVPNSLVLYPPGETAERKICAFRRRIRSKANFRSSRSLQSRLANFLRGQSGSSRRFVFQAYQ